MLKTRILTALVLLAVLLPVLFFAYFPAFAVLATLFLGAAVWEAGRLFGLRAAPAWALGVATLFVYVLLRPASGGNNMLFAVCAALWLMRFTPSLAIGLPPLKGSANYMVAFSFCFALFGCFVAIVALFQHSPAFLLSAMALVWVADIGAYFSGKAFGKRKLAPSISPGKSWEGAIGGAIAVLALSAASILAAPAAPWLADTFAVLLQARMGWFGALAILIVIVAASVVGDLFESQLKRRAAMKDSSNLLPGHGGVLDRIDALIPVLPLAALIGSWL
jgi:phosphatidate cytidylyltransferase